MILDFGREIFGPFICLGCWDRMTFLYWLERLTRAFNFKGFEAMKLI